MEMLSLATSMPNDEIEHASMHIGETLVCIGAWRDRERIQATPVVFSSFI